MWSKKNVAIISKVALKWQFNDFFYICFNRNKKQRILWGKFDQLSINGAYKGTVPLNSPKNSKFILLLKRNSEGFSYDLQQTESIRPIRTGDTECQRLRDVMMMTMSSPMTISFVTIFWLWKYICKTRKIHKALSYHPDVVRGGCL